MYSKYSELKFRDTHNYQALGRNGYMKQIGIDFWAYEGEIRSPLRIYPVNSRKVQGRGFIEIPLNELTPLITELIKIKNDYLEWEKRK